MKYPVLSIVFFWIFTADCYSQETQVPVDNEGKIESIDAQLRVKLGLFGEFDGFKEARLFETADNEFILEISYKHDSRTLRKRIPYSADEVKTLRLKVTDALKGTLPQSALDQEGRTKLIITSTAASFIFYAPAVPVILNMKSGKAVASTYMFTSALGFYIPFAATKNAPVSEAAANGYLYGTTRGVLHGLLLDLMAFGNDNSSRRVLTFAAGGSIAEAFALYKIVTIQNWTVGRTELLGVTGDFGMGIGLAAPVVANLEESSRTNAASVLIGTGVGFAASNYLSRVEHYTQGDAFVFRGAGTMGAYASLSAVYLTKTKNENVYAGTFIAGSLGGLFLGNNLVHEKDFTPAQGTFIELGQFAGWLTGLGIAYLIQDPSSSSNSRIFTTLSALGGISGYTLMYRTFADKAHEKASHSNWNFHVMPQNLLMSTLNKSFSISVYSLPVVTLDMKF